MLVDNQPLVSCICITHNHVDFLKRSVRCFQYQTYPNRELIVAFSSDNHSAAEFLKQINDRSIRLLIFPSSQSITLGEKRNMAIEYSSGVYWCVWDDDDWHNTHRIAYYIKALSGTIFKSAALSSVLLFDQTTNEAYVSGTRYAWEQTLICERTLFQNPDLRYLKTARGEDSSLVASLKKDNFLLTISNPALYIYVYHGRNTFHRGHWEVNILPWAKKLLPPQSNLVHRILQGQLANREEAFEVEQILQALTAGPSK
jgi:glycosyltransferase involved in cell wall biosynthesis